MGSVDDISQLCRLCLVKEQVNIPIFGDNSDNGQTFVKINSCLPVKVSRDDNLPKKICDGCSYKLDMLYIFRNTSLVSEKQLITWLNQAGLSTISQASSVKDPLANAKPEIMVKQETFDTVDTRVEGDNSEMGIDTQSYIIQQQQLPYQQDFEFGDEDGSNADATDEPVPKRAKRTSTLKKAPIEETEEIEDDLDAAMQITKAEDEDSEDLDQPDYVEAPVTSADDQPGPSGVGKAAVEAPWINRFLELQHLHSINEDPGKNHTCRTCRKKFNTNSQLRQHRYYVHNSKTKSHLCYVCGKLFDTKNQMQLHLESHDNTLKHYCEVCDKHLKTTHLVRTHRLLHSIAGQKCPDCNVIYNFTSSRAFYAHRRLHNLTESFICEECGKSFNQKDGLRQHKRIHENITYSCNCCDKIFKCRSGLIKHVAVVHEGKRCICEVCGKALTTAQNLKEHMMIHNGNKPFNCDNCDKSFATKYHLKVHERNHTNEKPYPCGFCDKAFASSSSFHLHVRTVHKKRKPYICGLCLKSLTTKTALKTHAKVCWRYVKIV